jgi:galactitol PTS system EIIA component
VVCKFCLDKNVVEIGLDEKDKYSALNKISKMLLDNGYVKDSYPKSVIEREKVFPTGLIAESYGIAIPHTDTEHVISPMIAIATLKDPIEFNMMGGDESDTISVKVIFMLAMNDGHAQIKLLQNIMSIIQNTSLMEKIYQANNKDELIHLLNDKLSV